MEDPLSEVQPPASAKYEPPYGNELAARFVRDVLHAAVAISGKSPQS